MLSSIMELQEDAYRVQQVLENVDIKDIIKFLRTKVTLLDTEIRCQLALQYFLNLEDVSAKKEESFADNIRSDLLCIKHILKSVPEEEIVELLNVLGPIPNRKYVAVKILLREHSRPPCRKKRKNNCDKQTDIGEASSSKVVKVSELNEPFQLKNNNLDSDKERKETLKLTIKSVKDRNGNDKFMVTSPVKIRSEPKTGKSGPQEVGATSVDFDEAIFLEEIKSMPSSHPWNPPVEKQNNVTYEIPSTSRCTKRFKIKPATFHPPAASTSSQKNGLSHLPSAICTNFFQNHADLSALPGSSLPAKAKPTIFKLPEPTTRKELNLKSSNVKEAELLDSTFKLPEPTSTQELNLKSSNVKEPELLDSTFKFPEPTSTQELNHKSSNVKKEELVDFDFKFPEPNKKQERNGESSNVKKSKFLDFNLNLPEPTSTQKELNPAPQLVKSNEVLIINEDRPSSVIGESGIDLPQVPKFIDEKLVFKLVELLPHVTSDYIRDLCAGKRFSEQNLDEITEIVFATHDVPMRPEKPLSPVKEIDLEEQLITVKELLPDADPSYLREKLDQLGGDSEAVQRFLDHAMETKEYPTMKEYLRKQQLSAQQRQYTTEFNVERFVELFPDPVETFEDPNRKTTILDLSDKYYVKWFMRNKYNQLYAKDVNSIVDTEGPKNIVSVVRALNTCLAKGAIKKTRWVANSRPDTQNIPLLQELAYFDHIDQIYSHIECKKAQAAEERKNAKELGLLQTCSCCYDEEVMPSDILTCCGGCRFCRDCIKKGTEVAFGEGKLTFPCLMDCGAEFSLQVLQNVLPPKVFSKLAQKKAVAEVKAAGVEDLETCPFCDFATIPAPEDKLFRCLNSDCMKESCRLCKEPSHVPLRCEEVEKDQAIKARTYIEDKMTEALIRQCWKCNAKFIKLEGCNKMTCSCGAIMCYVCRKPVKDYKHFNGQGGDRHDLCPLYTDNFSVNEKNVLKAAEEAKKQIDPAQLKNDPTADLEKHFGDKIKEADRRAKMNAAGAPRPALHAGQYQEVQRLRNEIREQLRLVQDLNINPQNILDAVAPQLNQTFRQRQPPYVLYPPAQPAIPPAHPAILPARQAIPPARPAIPTARPAFPPARQPPAPPRQGPYIQVRADLQRHVNDLLDGGLRGLPQNNPIVNVGQRPAPPAQAPQRPRADI